MPLEVERAGERDRLFVFLDGLEFVDGCGPVERVLEPLLAYGSYRFYKNLLEEKHLLLERIGQAHAVFLDWSNLTPKVLTECKKIETVAYIGVGAANFVDLEAAARLGIAVSNTPDYGNRSVAEHALGLILAAARNTVAGDGDLRRGLWTQMSREGIQIKGRSIGLVGLGKVGREMARLCHAFGMRVFYHDPLRQQEMEEIASYLTLDELLSSCDVVSLHLVLNEDTRNFIGEREIALMQPGSILVNTSRGEVLDLGAVARALREGRLRGAGLDNFPGEPTPDLRELASLKNVTLTPHVAFNTREAKDRMTDIAVSNVVSFYEGRPDNIVNPDYLARARYTRDA
jgi:D-3-phosphoglycerate dehydrogenase